MLKGAILLCIAAILWDQRFNDAHVAIMAGQLMWYVLGWSDQFAGHVVPTGG